MQFNSTETEATVNDRPIEEEKKENFFIEMKRLLEQYVRDRILLFKLEMSKKAANATASAVNAVALGLFALFALVFISITLGFVFSKLTGSFIWGFGIISAIYVLLVIICIAARKWVIKKVADAVIGSIYSKKKEAKASNNGSNGKN